MPGLVGFTFNESEAPASRAVLIRMRDSIVHRDDSILDELVIAERAAATRVHIDVIQKLPQPFNRDGVSVWIDGEFQPRMRVPLSLSHDHRLTDGADGARFLNWLVEALENPLLLALD